MCLSCVCQPTNQPTNLRTNQPTSQSTNQPNSRTTNVPVCLPTYLPTYLPTHPSTYLTTNSTNSTKKILSSEATAFLLVKKFFEYYCTRKFIIILTTARHFSFFQIQLNPVHAHSSSFPKSYFNILLPSTLRFSK